jgi:hypothetical protein
LHPGDDFALGGDPDPHVRYGFYKRFDFCWQIANTGSITWSGRMLCPVKLSPIKMKTPRIDIPALAPNEKATLNVELNTRGNECGSPYLTEWEIRDSEGRSCFPNKDPIRLTVEVENERNSKTEDK